MSYKITFYKRNNSSQYEVAIDNQTKLYNSLNIAINTAENYYDSDRSVERFEIINAQTNNVESYGVPGNAWATTLSGAKKNASADLYNTQTKQWG